MVTGLGCTYDDEMRQEYGSIGGGCYYIPS